MIEILGKEISIAYMALIFIGLLGFALASFIRFKKTRKKKMVCIVGEDCDKVVNSEYSKFLGFPVEVLGMVYYAMVILVYTSFIFGSIAAESDLVFWVLAITTGGLLFSAYLTFIQGFVLREWCEWCLTSAFFCVLIFIIAFTNVSNLTDFLREIQTSMLVIYSLAIALGVGAATITNVLFFKFLKDLKITNDESDVLRSVSQVMWLSLALLIISGSALYYSGSMYFQNDAIFLMMTIIVSVIIVVEAFLNLWIAPKLVEISFGTEKEESRDLYIGRKLAFALGAVSVVSWYALLVLKSIYAVPITLNALLVIYIFVVVFAVAMSRVADKTLLMKTH